MNLKCVITEDHIMFLQLLAGMLRTLPGLELMATAQTAAEGIQACHEHKPDLLILDLSLPDQHGLAVVCEFATANPDGRIIILSAEANSFVPPPEFERSIHAVVDKTCSYEKLSSEISALLSEISHLSPRVSIPAAPETLLTRRELEIFSSIGLGLTSKDIAFKLGISLNTVETHRKNIVAKLRFSGSELVHMATIYNQTSLNGVI